MAIVDHVSNFFASLAAKYVRTIGHRISSIGRVRRTTFLKSEDNAARSVSRHRCRRVEEFTYDINS